MKFVCWINGFDNIFNDLEAYTYPKDKFISSSHIYESGRSLMIWETGT